MFEKASRLKVRFTTSKGQLTVEDLWDLPMTSQNAATPNLNAIAKDLNRQLRDEDIIDFVDEKTPTRALLELKFGLVKHIISVRRQEATDRTTAIANKQKADRIQDILKTREDQALANMSTEDLTKMIQDLKS